MADAATMEQRTQAAPIASLAPFVRPKAALLTTYRRDGTPVNTAVNIAVEGDRAFVRSWETSGKMKRIRNNPEVKIAPSTMSAKPIGPAIRARARVLSGTESEHASRLIARKHPILQGIMVPIFHRLRGLTTAHVELKTDRGLRRNGLAWPAHGDRCDAVSGPLPRPVAQPPGWTSAQATRVKSALRTETELISSKSSSAVPRVVPTPTRLAV
jgi:PPOX class probable F420-dependent enzyme